MPREWHQTKAGQPLFFQTLFTAQIEQVNDECCIGHFATQTADQFYGCFDGAAGRQQIVNHKDFIASLDRIDVDLQLIGTVFQFVAFRDGFTRQFTRFTYRYKANTQA